MIAMYVVLPLALLVAASAVAAFAWTVRSGQLDDVDTPPLRILFDEEPLPLLSTIRDGAALRARDSHVE